MSFTNNKAIWITRKHRDDVNAKLLLEIDLASRGIKTRMNIIAKHCQANLLGDGASDEFPKLEYRQTRSMKTLPPYPGDNLRQIHCYDLETSQKFHSSICSILGRLESFLLGKSRKKH